MISNSVYDFFLVKIIGSMFGLLAIFGQLEVGGWADILTLRGITVSGLLLGFLIYFIRETEKIKKDHKADIERMEGNYKQEILSLKETIKQKDSQLEDLYNKIIEK